MKKELNHTMQGHLQLTFAFFLSTKKCHLSAIKKSIRDMSTSRQHTSTKPCLEGQMLLCGLWLWRSQVGAFVLFLSLSKQQGNTAGLQLPSVQNTSCPLVFNDVFKSVSLGSRIPPHQCGSYSLIKASPWTLTASSSNKIRWTEEVWGLTATILACRRLRQEDCSEFKVSLDHTGLNLTVRWLEMPEN